MPYRPTRRGARRNSGAPEELIEEGVERISRVITRFIDSSLRYDKESALDYWFQEDMVDQVLEWPKCDDVVRDLTTQLLDANQENTVRTAVHQIFNDQTHYDVVEDRNVDYTDEDSAFVYKIGEKRIHMYPDDEELVGTFMSLRQMREDAFAAVVDMLYARYNYVWESDFRIGRPRIVPTLEDVFGGKTSIHYNSGSFLVLKPKWNEILEALQKVATETEPEELEEDEKVYEWKDGSYMTIVPLKKLRAEGAALGICVGRADMPYRQAVAKGTTTIYSIRTKDGKPKFTIEHRHGRPPGEITQIKGKANRLPGFAAGKDGLGDQVKPDEVEKVAEIVREYFQMDPMDIADLRPGLKALEEWKAARAKKVAEEKAAKLAKRASRDGPRENPGRRNPATIPVSARIARMAEKAYNQPWGGRWGA